MTVGELIEKLRGLPQDAEVLTYGMDIHTGQAERVPAQPPVEVFTRRGGITQVIIDGDCA